MEIMTPGSWRFRCNARAAHSIMIDAASAVKSVCISRSWDKSTSTILSPVAGIVHLRVFLPAGARTLLMTLWEVHGPVTKEFMDTFQTADRVGQAPHPHYWAAFLPVGDSRPAVHCV